MFVCESETRPSTFHSRAVAQFGSALDWGSMGRGFKSRQSDERMSMTIPNFVSFTRLLGVILLGYFGLIAPNYSVIIVLFVYAGVSDWLDGFLARKLNQFSRLGEVLDPLADRLYIVMALFIVLKESLLPTWIVAVVLLREVMVGVLFLILRLQGFENPPVHYIGKAGTLMLMYALPLTVLGAFEFSGANLIVYVGSAFLGWAIVTYWYAGYLYLRQSIAALKGK